VSREIRRVARAVRNHSARAVGAYSSKPPKLAIVRKVDPLTAEMADHRLQLDEDDLLLTQAMRRYHRDTGIAAGDTLVLIPVSTDDFVVVGVLSQENIDAGIASASEDTDGREFASGVGVTSTPIVAVVPYYDDDGEVVGYIPLIA
jgi:hypothetical protein